MKLIKIGDNLLQFDKFERFKVTRRKIILYLDDGSRYSTKITNKDFREFDLLKELQQEFIDIEFLAKEKSFIP